MIGGAEHARVLVQHVRRPARALRGARAGVGVLRTGQAHGAVDGILADAARDARRVAGHGLDKARSTQLAQEVEKKGSLGFGGPKPALHTHWPWSAVIALFCKWHSTSSTDSP